MHEVMTQLEKLNDSDSVQWKEGISENHFRISLIFKFVVSRTCGYGLTSIYLKHKTS